MSNLDEDISAFGRDFDAFRKKFDGVRAKGVVFSDEQQIEYQSGAKKLRIWFKRIEQANSSNRSIPVSDLARREVLLSNLEDSISRVQVFSMQKGAAPRSVYGKEKEAINDAAKKERLNPMQISGGGLIQQNERTIALQDSIIGEIAQGVDGLHQQVCRAVEIWLYLYLLLSHPTVALASHIAII